MLCTLTLGGVGLATNCACQLHLLEDGMGIVLERQDRLVSPERSDRRVQALPRAPVPVLVPSPARVRARARAGRAIGGGAQPPSGRASVPLR